jgi:hypothetical protein
MINDHFSMAIFNIFKAGNMVWHPSGVHVFLARQPEVSTAFRPPATFWQPFGLRVFDGFND